MYKKVLGVFLVISCFVYALANDPETDAQIRNTTEQEADKASLHSKHLQSSLIEDAGTLSFDSREVFSSDSEESFRSFVQSKYTLATFLQSLEQYRLNAYWITKDFMQLSVDEFEKAWLEVVTILSHPEKRWFYFCDKKDDFYEEDYWAKFLRECVLYDAWITKTYVDIATGELLYKEEADRTPERVMLLSDYWALFANKNESTVGNHPNTQFYAFFIDCLSHFYCRAVDEAYYALSDTNAYNSSILAAKLCLERINRYLPKIKASHIMVSYQLTVKKYQEVIDLLEQERLRHLLGELYA
jgi:hypothetical protein